MIEIPCIILAGGKSSRMGENKALLPFGKFSTLCEFQHARLKPLFSKIFISSKDRDVFGFEADFLNDLVDDIFSPTVALYSILKTLDSSVFTISVDTPFIDKKTIDRLYAKSQGGTITTIAASPRGLHPLCGIYTIDSLVYFREMVKNSEHKLRRVLEKIPHKIVKFDDDEIFFNLNNKEEYKMALKLYKQQ